MQSLSPQLYLASQSPRRRELLMQIGLSIAVLNIQIPEIPQLNEAPMAFAKRMALTKAKTGWQSAQRKYDCPVLSADTIVVCDNRILGKPADREEGIAMLTQLSAKTHQVITAVAVVREEQVYCDYSVSQVTFRALQPAEIMQYWETGEPCDKAGAYAIQGLAATFIAHLEGSYSGVMGLPLYETAKLLNKLGIAVLA